MKINGVLIDQETYEKELNESHECGKSQGYLEALKFMVIDKNDFKAMTLVILEDYGMHTSRIKFLSELFKLRFNEDLLEKKEENPILE